MGNRPPKFTSKLPHVGTTIFTTMSALANEHGAINLSQGFPNYDCSDHLKSLVSEAMAKGYNQYAPMAGLPALRERLAEKMGRSYDCVIDPVEEVTITAGATQALFTAFTAFVRPGDEVVIIEPAYDSYRPAIEVNGGKAVPYICQGPEYRIDWAAFGRLLSSRTRMIVLNTPHNPTGRIFHEDDLRQLAGLVEGTDILILSDEVYEHLVFDGELHQSVWRFPELRDRCLATYSFGKTFHNTGWKVGYCVAPAHLMKEFRKVHQYNVFSVNTPMQYALASYLDDPLVYLQLGRFYMEKRDRFLQYLEGSRFDPIPCEGTYFQLVSYSRISEEDDIAFTRRLIEEKGIAAIPVSAFYSDGRDERVIRFCFAKTDELLDLAGERIAGI
jgi:methionine aminotransferase